MIKFVDLKAQTEEIAPRVEGEIAALHESAAYVGGPQVAAFEEEFGRFLGVRRVVGVSSGTDALRLALLALGVGQGDEVVTSPLTFIGTVEAIVQTGARPAFVDVDPATCNLSVPALIRYLESRPPSAGRRVRAIVPVHLYGLPAPMPQIRLIAETYGLKVVEDACQAHGSRVFMAEGWTRCGAIGDAGCFSFYPGKNLGGWGEGGAVALNDDELAARVISLRDHGRLSHYAHSELGYNARLDTLQAIVLRAKLQRLEAWNARRRQLAMIYRELLPSVDMQLLPEGEGVESSFHLFVIRSERRDAIRDRLLSAGIGCGIHYPVPLHLQPALRFLGHRHGEFPASERAADSVLSLPMHPHLSDGEVQRVAAEVRAALDGTRHDARH